MRRRRFAGMLACGLLAARNASRAQAKVHRVGLVSIGTDPERPVRWQPFRDAMRELGHVEGRNLEIADAFANGDAARLQGLVDELVRSEVSVIVTTGNRETAAARKTTSTIPIVMLLVPDPVAQGFVASLGRPGGNVTGLTSMVPGLSQKYVELLRDMLPGAAQLGVVAAPPNPTELHRRELQDAAARLGVGLRFLSVQGQGDFDPVLQRAKREGVSGIIATLDPLTFQHRHALVDAALKHRMGGIYWDRAFVEAGGLMTYSASFVDLQRRGAGYVDKLLKGTKPADLPVEQPIKFELVINLKTAKALGITIPHSVLLRADEVIE